MREVTTAILSVRIKVSPREREKTQFFELNLFSRSVKADQDNWSAKH